MKISDYLDRIAEELERLTREGRTKKVETLVPELKDPETRKALAEVILAQFKRWDLHEVNQAMLLGLAEMTELRQGEPLPDDSMVLERVGHLLAIDRALSKLYPSQPNSRDRWISTPQPHLGARAPLELMLVGGIQAIKEVRAMVESDVEASRL